MEDALDAALGLGGGGLDGLAAELTQGTLELCGAGILRVVLCEDAVAVAVAGHGHAEAGDIDAERLEIGAGRLDRDEAGVHQAAGGVVDEGDQATARTASLEPVVGAAIDLHEFAPACPTFTGRMRALARPFGGLPQPCRDHPAAQGLDRVGVAVLRGQVLGRERGAEVGVALADQFDAACLLGGSDAPIRGARAATAEQSPRSGVAVGAHQALDLTHGERQPRGGLALRQAPGENRLHHLAACQFAMTHCQ